MKPDNLLASKVPIPASNRQMRTNLYPVENRVFFVSRGFETEKFGKEASPCKKEFLPLNP